MSQEWNELTELTQGRAFAVERIRLLDSDVAIEGSFEVPPLARLSPSDQVFVTAFVRSHGSIKQMEQLFGVSYPTIKNRLNRIGDMLDYVQVRSVPPISDLLDRIDRGEISVADALERLSEQ